MKRILSFLLITITIFSVLSGHAYAFDSREMSIYFIDCGQGDAIFISSKNESMLIDAGKASNIQKVLSFLNTQDIDEIEYVFSSHPDEDHIGGMPEVYDCYQINNSYYSSYTANTGIYQKYMDAVKNEPNSNFSAVDENDSFVLGDAEIDIISDGKGYSNANDASLVLKVTCGEKSLLLTGDISQTVEADLVASDKNIDVDILKVGHHGSASSSSAEFLSEVSPDVAVISVGTGNSYGHPTEQALNRLSAVCSNIYRTDEQGTILLEVSENTITYKDAVLEGTEASYCPARTVYVTSSGKKYHASSLCSNMKNPISKSLTDAKEAGYTACSKCVSSDFETGNIPHTYTDDCDTSCNACGEVRTAKHRFGNYIYNDDATATADGTKTRTCSLCGYTQTVAAEGTRLENVLLDTALMFTDVKASAWYKPYIDYSVTYGILSGAGNGKMLPNKTMTRAEFVQVLANLSGVDTSNKNITTEFTDVKSGAWYAPAVKWASENGIVSGVGDGKFSPNANITREQMCSMLVRYVEKYLGITLENSIDKKTFADDNKISSWAKDSVYKCQQSGLVSGVSETSFAPRDNATRASVATIMSKFHEQYLRG